MSPRFVAESVDVYPVNCRFAAIAERPIDSEMDFAGLIPLWLVERCANVYACVSDLYGRNLFWGQEYFRKLILF